MYACWLLELQLQVTDQFVKILRLFSHTVLMYICVRMRSLIHCECRAFDNLRLFALLLIPYFAVCLSLAAFALRLCGFVAAVAATSSPQPHHHDLQQPQPDGRWQSVPPSETNEMSNFSFVYSLSLSLVLITDSLRSCARHSWEQRCVCFEWSSIAAAFEVPFHVPLACTIIPSSISVVCDAFA